MMLNVANILNTSRFVFEVVQICTVLIGILKTLLEQK